MKNKKGVSPLLAAVLLIAFSIALASIVSTFIIKKTKEFNPESIAQESTYCESVTLSYRTAEALGIVSPIGSSNVHLFNGLLIVNKGTFSIHQFRVTAPGFPTRPYPIDTIDKTLKPGDPIELKIQINPSSENKEIKIVPVIKDVEKEDQLVTCASRQIVVDYEKLCIEVLSTPDLGDPEITGCPPL